MAEREHVVSAGEWKALPEIVAPVIDSPVKSGSKYRVHKVGIVLSDAEQCAGAEVKPLGGVAGRYALPTAVVDFGAEKKLCRLPLGLTDWAMTVIGWAQTGQLSFPSEVEFGQLDGRVYAEFL